MCIIFSPLFNPPHLELLAIRLAHQLPHLLATSGGSTLGCAMCGTTTGGMFCTDISTQ